ncbi:hypothetical protein NW762_013700 [Fusarium torreyae]|uniref:Uncharacterized protein n=1 Tax=Fusarium torreyae TaxID=1237075 RepID=A0A9W8RND4_9HYPO|nr:hypothetical protein NW762_013700 [Fusarium torreyae]
MGILSQAQNCPRQVRVAIAACCFVFLAGLLFQITVLPSYNSRWEFNESDQVTDPVRKPPMPKPLVKPDNITVSGLVFYGRKSRVSSLRCYLERNMVDNGGWLDEVLWIVNTNNKEDLRYLDEITANSPTRHKKVIPEKHLATYTYKKAWRHLERGKYYIKIDDDILWIDDDAIPNLVTRKLENPDDFVVSGNIINNPPLGFFHYRMGALHPYFPEPSQPAFITNLDTPDYWKPSRHGFWDGSPEFKWDLKLKPPKYPNHRWLRVANDSMLYQTPVSHLKYEVWGNSYKNWAIASQMHMSLLENIETNQLDLYKFEKPYIMYGDRIRINFMCIYGDDILDTDPENWPKNQGDEDMLVLKLPQKLRRRKYS